MAGLLQRRLIGPIWKSNILVTTLWIGDPLDPEGGKDMDVVLAMRVIATGSAITVAAACLIQTFRFVRQM